MSTDIQLTGPTRATGPDGPPREGALRALYCSNSLPPTRRESGKEKKSTETSFKHNFGTKQHRSRNEYRRLLDHLLCFLEGDECFRQEVVEPICFCTQPCRNTVGKFVTFGRSRL